MIVQQMKDFGRTSLVIIAIGVVAGGITACVLHRDPPPKPAQVLFRQNGSVDQAVAYMQAESPYGREFEDERAMIVLPPNTCVYAIDRNVTKTARVTVHVGKCDAK